jgi:hypothetical protein
VAGLLQEEMLPAAPQGHLDRPLPPPSTRRRPPLLQVSPWTAPVFSLSGRPRTGREEDEDRPDPFERAWPLGHVGHAGLAHPGPFSFFFSFFFPPPTGIAAGPAHFSNSAQPSQLPALFNF